MEKCYLGSSEAVDCLFVLLKHPEDSPSNEKRVSHENSRMNRLAARRMYQVHGKISGTFCPSRDAGLIFGKINFPGISQNHAFLQ